MSRDTVLATLRRHSAEIRAYGATSLYLFGSAVRDEITEDSDVDIFVDYERDGSFTFVEWLRLEDYLKTMLNRDVDLATRDGLHPRLREGIERSSVRVF